MPFTSENAYIDSSFETGYEMESSYYLNFPIISALYSIERLLEYQDSSFENEYQYYHYYTDHLLFSIRQIANRFVINEGKDKGIKLERKKANRTNFCFSDELYPILSNKAIGNTIEHIDEHNQSIIKKEQGVGGFNVVFDGLDERIAKAILTKRKVHPYTLDLINRKVLIVRKEKEIDFGLDDLKNELLQLKQRVKKVIDIITDPILF